MVTIVINNLEENRELDKQTMVEIQGGKNSLFQQNFNNALSGAFGVTGINPYTLGTDDFFREVALNGNSALLSSPGFNGGAAALISGWSCPSYGSYYPTPYFGVQYY